MLALLNLQLQCKFLKLKSFTFYRQKYKNLYNDNLYLCRIGNNIMYDYSEISIFSEIT